MISLGGGILALILGIIFIIYWRIDFLITLRGVLPVMFLFGGALAAYLGYEEIKDKKASEKFGDDANELKSEVESLKEEIKGLKEEKKSPPKIYENDASSEEDKKEE